MGRRVTIYTKTGCPYCVAAKEDLDRRNIRFEEINVYEKPEAKKKVVELTGGRLVPVIVDGNNITVGFQGGG
ncbi:MAG: Uxx-star family glutaredoxin-like (seleno)protein [Candidatus Zixiibacteriota bacterium]